MGHREYAAVVILVVTIQLTLDTVAGSSHSVSIGATTLDDKIGYHPVEGKSVIKSLFG